MGDEKRYQEIVFSVQDFDGGKEEMFNTVAQQLKILLDAGYLAVVRYDEPGLGIIIIDFEHDEHFDAWGIANPVWITEDEEIYLANRNEVCCEESLNGEF